MVQHLDSDLIKASLVKSAQLWLRQLDVFESIDSTNLHLARAAVSGPIDGHVAVAEFQTAGRGRRGRTWSGTAGANVALSMGHAVDVPVSRVGALSLVVGLAAVDVLECAGVDGVGLKWPNDVMLNGAKLGGVLIELVDATPPVSVIIGIGLNVELDAATRASIPAPVATIRDVCDSVDRNALIGALISRVHDFTRAFEQSGFTRFKPVWESLDIHAGQLVDVAGGDHRTTGRVSGVTDAGELRLDTEAGELTFNAGEVSLRVSPD